MPAPIRAEWFNRPGWSEYKAARGGGQKHWGYDSYCAPRSTIYAIGTGRVVARGYAAGGFGHFIDVFYPGLNVRQREAHMNEATNLKLGAQVTSSTALGRVGRTGNAKNIYWIRNGVELWHVHSQAWRGNTTNGDLNVDPRNYWGGTAGDDIIRITAAQEANVRVIKNEKTGEHARVGESTVFLMNAAFANNEAAVWNVDGKHIVLSDENFKRTIWLAEETARRRDTQPVAPIDYVALAREVAKVLPKATIDTAAIAQAVIDDAAKRLAQ